MELLAHLLERTLHITADDLYFVLVSVLRLSAAPYFRSVYITNIVINSFLFVSILLPFLH